MSNYPNNDQQNYQYGQQNYQYDQKGQQDYSAYGQQGSQQGGQQVQYDQYGMQIYPGYIFDPTTRQYVPDPAYQQQTPVVNVNVTTNVGGAMTGTSDFDGGLLQLIGWSIVCTLLCVFTLFIGVPWAVCILKRWETNHTIVDGHRLVFDGHGGQLFGKYIVWWLLSVITLGIYGLWLPIKMRKWTAYHTHFAN